MLAIFGARPARFFMTNPKCPNCHGIGWVCENHPDKPWDDEIGRTCRQCGNGSLAPANHRICLSAGDLPCIHAASIDFATPSLGKCSRISW
jgi:hypothetical protein